MKQLTKLTIRQNQMWSLKLNTNPLDNTMGWLEFMKDWVAAPLGPQGLLLDVPGVQSSLFRAFGYNGMKAMSYVINYADNLVTMWLGNGLWFQIFLGGFDYQLYWS